jgi:uncharacterized protein
MRNGEFSHDGLDFCAAGRLDQKYNRLLKATRSRREIHLAIKTIPITIDETRIADFCRRHHIERLCLFGSVLRADFRDDSDVDVLVQFQPGYTPGWDFFGMQDELSGIIGRQVDLNTQNFLSRYFRAGVLAEALPNYDSRTA